MATIQRISVSTSGVVANGGSYNPSVSSDGRFVVFQSSALNLTPEFGFSYSNHSFVRDTYAETTSRITWNNYGQWPAVTSISPDGKTVPLIAYDWENNSGIGSYQIYLRDLEAGSVERISVAPDGAWANMQGGNPYTALLSDDGSALIWNSSSSNLVVGDDNGTRDIFYRGAITGPVELVSVALDGTAGDDSSEDARISANGRFVVFASAATDLVAGDANGVSDVFLRDMQLGTTHLVSVSAEGIQADGGAYGQVIFPRGVSDNGRFVTFYSLSTNLVPGGSDASQERLLLKDMHTGAVTAIPGNPEGLPPAQQPSTTGQSGQLLPDGSTVIFAQTASSTDWGPADRAFVFAYDVATGAVTRLWENPPGLDLRFFAFDPVLSSDGKTLSFAAQNASFSSGDINQASSVFLIRLDGFGGEAGGEAGERLAGADGDDTLAGLGGNDTLIGGTGDDLLTGGADDDQLFGQAGRDTLRGEAGQDTLYAGDSADHLSGGDGDDNLMVTRDVAAGSVLDGGDGTDRLVIRGAAEGGYSNLPSVTVAADVVVTHVEKLVFSGSIAMSAAQLAGFSMISAEGPNSSASFTASVAGLYDFSLPSVTGRIGFSGSAGDDTLVSPLANDSLNGLASGNGGAGNDLLIGSAGSDNLFDDAGENTLRGGEGNDNLSLLGTATGVMEGGLGNDTLMSLSPGTPLSFTARGGEGNDYFSIGSAGGQVTIEGGEGQDTVFGFTQPGAALTLLLDAGAGDDQLNLSGVAAGSVLDGGAGEDTLFFYGSGFDPGVTIRNVETLVGSGTLSISATQFVGFSAFTGPMTLRASDAGTYDFTGKTVTNLWGMDGSAGDDVIRGVTWAGNFNSRAGAGDDLIETAARSNFIQGGDGDDTIRSANPGGGSEVLEGGAGDDSIQAGNSWGNFNGDAGNDTISTGAGGGFVQGGADDDLLIGGVARDDLSGGAGNDTLRGGGGDDWIMADDYGPDATGGDDSIEGGAGNDTVFAGKGRDQVFGDDGDDQLWSDGEGSLLEGGIGDDALNAVSMAGSNTLRGGEGNDRFSLGSGGSGNRVEGGAGNDNIMAGGSAGVFLGEVGNDSILAWGDNHTLSGGDGNDWLNSSGQNADLLEGGAGQDQLYDFSGADTLRGGEGDDSIYAGASAIVEGGEGDDSIYASAATGQQVGSRLDGGAGADTLSLGDVVFAPDAVITGIEKLSIQATRQDLRWLDGAYERIAVEQSVSLSAAQLAGFSEIEGFGYDVALGANVTSAFRLNGTTAGHYDLSGKTIIGSAVLTGSAGDDTLTGTAAADTLQGGEGDDVLIGGAGNDLLEGGAGFDTAVFTGRRADYTISFAPDGTLTLAEQDTLRGIERLLFVDMSVQQAAGGGQTIAASGAAPANLTGEATNDALTGSTGGDTLNGGEGADTLTGGAGQDSFVGTAAQLNGDRIADYEAEEVILVQDARFTAGDVTLTRGSTIISVDTDQDGTADLTVTLDLDLPQMEAMGWRLAVTPGPEGTSISFVPTGPGITIITADTTWSGGVPYDLAGRTIQVAPGATLTIEAGAQIIGGSIEVSGDLAVLGRVDAPVELQGVAISPRGYASHVTLDHVHMQGGSLFQGGVPGAANLTLTNSVVEDVQNEIYIWYPNEDVLIENNLFLRSGGISAGTQGNVTVTVRDNSFAEWLGDAAVTNWNSIGESRTVVTGNNFLSTDRIALQVQAGNDGAAMQAEGNYFGTTDPLVIDAMVRDRTDSLAHASVIDVTPFLAAPNPLSGILAVTDPGGGSVVAGGSGAWIFGDRGPDSLTGTEAADRIQGGAGNDTLVGAGGDDVITGSAGADQIFGGAGRDTLSGGAGADSFLGTAAEWDGDRIEDYQAGERIIVQSASFSAGDVTLTQGSTIISVDTDQDGDTDLTVTLALDLPELQAQGLVLNVAAVQGSTAISFEPAPDLSGADLLTAAGIMPAETRLDGGVGDDTLVADNASFDPAATITNIETLVINGGRISLSAAQLAGFTTIRSGTPGEPAFILMTSPGVFDMTGKAIEGVTGLAGGPGGVTILANRGTLPAGQQFAIQDGSGDDSLVGTAGNDNITSFNGRDTIRGGAGDDTLGFGDTQTLFEGEDGNDSIFAFAAEATLRGGDGNDTLWSYADDALLEGGAGEDVLQVNFSSNWQAARGGDGDDLIQLRSTGAGVVDGGAGTDRVEVLGTVNAETSFTQVETLVIGGPATLNATQLSAFERIEFTGTGLTSTLNLAAPGLADFTGQAIAGLGFVNGTSGGDTIRGLTLETDPGFLTLYGLDGDDSIEGSAFRDNMTGDAGNDTLLGLGGNDLLFAGEGDNTLDGGEGDDVLFGRSGRDLLEGGAGADYLYGDSGSVSQDTLRGGTGQDSLYGGLGADTLSGGADQDSFIGTAAELDGDRIKDYQAGEQITVLGESFTASDVTLAQGSTIISVDTDQDGDTDLTVTLDLDLPALQAQGLVLNVSAVEGATAISFVAPPPAPNFELVSASNAGTPGNGGSGLADISGDGRYVVFISDASNLASPDWNGRSDIFLRDTLAQTTLLLGGSADGTPLMPRVNPNGPPEISNDGRFVVFAGDVTGTTIQIYLRDVSDGTITLLSRQPNGMATERGAYFPSISGDGRYAVFTSDDDALTPGDDNFATDVFRFDRETATLERVSVDQDGQSADRGTLHGVRISADGRFILFTSASTDLVPSLTLGRESTFLRDMVTGTTQLVSSTATGAPANGASYAGAVSADGRFALFTSNAMNLAEDLEGDPRYQLYRKDLSTGEITLISRNETGQPMPAGAFVHWKPALSADGQKILFSAFASNLVAGTDGPQWHVFLHDVTTSRTTLMSRGADGLPAPGDHTNPAFSDDGLSIVFQTTRDGLVPGDANGAGDIVLTRLPAPPALATEGHDTLTGSTNADTLDGLDGDDLLLGRAGDDLLLGRAGDDELIGDGGNDTLRGEAGRDTLRGGQGADSLDGGADDDVLLVSGQVPVGSVLDGGAGEDTLIADTAAFDPGVVIRDIETLKVAGETVTLSAAQLAGFTSIGRSNPDQFFAINASTSGAYDLSDVTTDGRSFALIGSEGADTLLAALDVEGMNLQGQGGDDLIIGSTGNDFIVGGDGQDTLAGGDGEDSVYDFSGDNLLDGGDGDDFVSAGGANATLLGGAGNDSITSSAPNARIEGGTGDDAISAFSTNAGSLTLQLDAGEGNDRIIVTSLVSAGSVLDGGMGEDRLSLFGPGLEAGATLLNIETLLISGFDTRLSAAQFASVDRIEAATEGASFGIRASGAGVYDLSAKPMPGLAQFWGSDGADEVFVPERNISIYGGDGNDTLRAGDNGSWLSGGGLSNFGQGGNPDQSGPGDGDDQLYGGEGSDFLIGGTGQNTLLGGSGHDSLVDQGTGSLLIGGDGFDVFLSEGVGARLDGGAGGDLLGIHGREAEVLGGEGNDSFLVFKPRLAGVLDGGAGEDTLTAQPGTVVETNAIIRGIETLVVGYGRGGDEEPQTASISLSATQLAGFATLGINSLDPSEFSAPAYDPLALNITATTAGTYDLSGKTIGALVTLTGTEGNDTLIGGSGNETLRGGAGDDLLRGSLGSDSLDGGAGLDTAAYVGLRADYTITGGNGRYSVQRIEPNSASFEDVLNDIERLVFDDGAMDLQLPGQVITAEPPPPGSTQGADLAGSAGDDTITGNAGEDTLTGGAGNDALDGGTSDDTLNGGLGLDTLVGGAGQDSYVGTPDELNGDRIEDYEAGEDIVVEGASFTEEDVTLARGSTIISVDLDQDGDPDLVVTLALDLPELQAMGLQLVVTPGPNGTVISFVAPTTPGLTDTGSPWGASTLTGGAGDDTLIGQGWNNTLIGGAGNDVLDGGAGQSVIDAGSGNNIILLDGWNNHVTAGPGNNVVARPDGNSTVQLGDGVASITLDGWSNQVTIGDMPSGQRSVIDAGEGNSVVTAGNGGVDVTLGGWSNQIEAGQGPLTVSGTAGNSSVQSSGGPTSIIMGGWGNQITVGATGPHVIDAGMGNAHVTVAGGDATIVARGWNNEIRTEDGDDDISGLEGAGFVWAGDGDNRVTASGWWNQIETGSGADRIIAGSGGARVSAGAGNDEVRLAGWHNVVEAGAGNDTIFAGEGDDRFIMNAAGTGVDQIFDFQSEVGDKLEFRGVSSGQVSVQAVGEDLSVTVGGNQVALLMGQGDLTLEELLANGSLLFA